MMELIYPEPDSRVRSPHVSANMAESWCVMDDDADDEGGDLSDESHDSTASHFVCSPEGPDAITDGDSDVLTPSPPLTSLPFSILFPEPVGFELILQDLWTRSRDEVGGEAGEDGDSDYFSPFIYDVSNHETHEITEAFNESDSSPFVTNSESSDDELIEAVASEELENEDRAPAT
ncbi:hypothetical protein IMZ48_02970, partial [Candidatus Bathyarchaeota archaeon]|nr:hypothetical protein [Candidatus Bathyarchaeota archaeon]